MTFQNSYRGRLRRKTLSRGSSPCPSATCTPYSSVMISSRLKLYIWKKKHKKAIQNAAHFGSPACHSSPVFSSSQVPAQNRQTGASDPQVKQRKSRTCWKTNERKGLHSFCRCFSRSSQPIWRKSKFQDRFLGDHLLGLWIGCGHCLPGQSLVNIRVKGWKI